MGQTVQTPRRQGTDRTETSVGARVVLEAKGDATMKVIVNGEPKEFSGQRLSYDDVLELDGVPPERRHLLLTVVYHCRNAEGWEKNGCLAPGQSVEALDGMTISTAYTGSA